MSTPAARVRSHLRLEAPWFRHLVLVGLSAAVAIAWLLAAVVDEVDASVGVAISLAILVLLVGVMLDHVVSLNTDPKGLEVHQDFYHANMAQLEFLRKEQPTEVKLCESTAWSALQILEELRKSENVKSIRLLVCHPDRLNKEDREHLSSNLRQLTRKVPAKDALEKGLQVKCYDHPASLRGRNYDGRLVVAGWYTYERLTESNGGGDESRRYVITGEQTPLVLARASDPAGGTLLTAFDDAFGRMWDEAVPLKQALADFEAGPTLAPGWVNAVSG